MRCFDENEHPNNKLLITLGLSFAAFSQVKTEVPPVVPGAKPALSSTSKFTAPPRRQSRRQRRRSRRARLPAAQLRHKKNRRYPVVYALHGYSIGAEQWSQEIHVPQTIEGAFAQGAQE